MNDLKGLPEEQLPYSKKGTEWRKKHLDWADDRKSVTITAEEGATPANIYLKAENANGISKIMYEPSSANGVTFNTSDVANDDMRIYIWENNLAPVTYPFVR